MTDTVHVTRSAGLPAANVSAIAISELSTLIGTELPTSDPLIFGAFWNDNGIVKVSPIPLVVSDFKNGIYLINSVDKVLSDLWVENLDWGPHDPTTIVNGIGYRLTATTVTANDFLASSAGLFAALNLPNGVVMVVDYVLQAAPANIHDCEISFNATGGPNFIWDLQFGLPNTFVSGDNSISYDPLSGRNRIALLLSTDTLASSRNGSTVEEVDGNSAAAADIIVLNETIQGGANETSMIIEKITFYAAQPSSALSTLSTF